MTDRTTEMADVSGHDMRGTPASPEAKQHPAWRAARMAGLLLGASFLAWIASRLLQNPQMVLQSLAPGGFALALLVGVAANATIGIVFSQLIAKLAGVSARRRIASYYFSQLAKYIPGRIAALLVQSATLNAPRAMTIAVVTNIELTAIVAWTCTVAAAFSVSLGSNPFLAFACGAMGVVITAWLIRLDWRPAIRLVTRLVRSAINDVDFETRSRPSWFVALAESIGLIALPAASMYVLIAYGLGYRPDTALLLTSALLMSWVAGTLAFVFPAGIGIRELLFVGLGHAFALAPTVDQIAAIALFSRFLQVMIDIFGIAGYALLDAFLRRKTGAR
jgi:hypothetical protein